MNPKRKLSILGAAAGGAVLAAAAVSAAGPNLVKNGDFSQGTSHWAPYLVNETIIQPGPNGTGEVINTSHVATDYNISVTQCINLSGDIYEMFLAGDIQIPSGQSRSGQAALWAWPFPEGDCKGSSDYSRGAPDVSAVGAWQHVDSSFIPPPWTRSIRVELRNHMAPAGPGEDPAGEFTVLFDNIALTRGDVVYYPAPTPDVPDSPNLPDLPDGPFDVPIPGPLGEPPVQTPPVEEPPVQDPPVQEPPIVQPPVVQPPAGNEPPADVPASSQGNESTVDVTSEPTPAPLPPSTGNGLARQDQGSSLGLLGAALMALAGAPSAVLAARRMRRSK